MQTCYKAGRGKGRTGSAVAFVAPTPAKKPAKRTAKEPGKTADDLMAAALARHDANIAKATVKPPRKRALKPDPDKNRRDRTIAIAYRDGPNYRQLILDAGGSPPPGGSVTGASTIPALDRDAE